MTSDKSNGQWVGIDVSQSKLDIALRPAERTWQVSNSASGWKSLREDLAQYEINLVVLEATGGLERGVAND